MTTVKIETNSKLIERLYYVLKQSEFVEFDELYYFKQFEETPNLENNALSYIRNGNYWTGLIEAEDDRTENYKIFCFKVNTTSNNSGFLGWMATEIKKKLGISIIVFCSHCPTTDKDILYIGCSSLYGNQVKNFIETLMN
jgi:hypothetical protein